jgi:uncharacterized protein YecE (DUF72 family)
VIRIGTAGWAIPRAAAERFPAGGSHLERYAKIFNCAEINSSFRHAHRPATYARWAAATPPGFRFSVKLPEEITHRRRLAGVVEPLARFLDEAGALGDRLGPLLVQLPGSLALDPRVAQTFFAVLRRRFDGPVVCEPRHASWFGATAEALLARHRIGRVAADPARVPSAAQPGGWLGDAEARGVAYFRWHGSPRVYRSSYDDERIAGWAAEIREWHARADCWCVFDNTTSGAATPNALSLACLLDVDGAAAAASGPAVAIL